MERKRHLLPYIALAVGISALSLSAMFVRWADAPGPVTGFYRLLFSTALLTPFIALRARTRGGASPSLLVFPVLAGVFTAF
ncbi:MAG: EamA family transporter, partial [Bacteroidota bacterium]